MIVSFVSIDKDNDRVSFEAEAHYEENTLVFPDLSMPNTMLYVTKVDDELVIIRDGEVKMDAYYIKNNYSTGIYEGNGLKFEFRIYTQELVVTKHKIVLEYVMSVENDIVGSNKITINIR